MREFERRMASMKVDGEGTNGEITTSANYLMKVGQTGTLPAQLRHAAVVRPIGKELSEQQQQQQQQQQPAQQQLRRGSLTSPTDVRQSPYVDGLVFYGPNVQNISALGTLSAAQSQQMRLALSQRLNNQNNGSNSSNPRLNMRVMSPPAAASRVAVASKQQETLNGHQRSKSVPRKVPSEILYRDNYLTNHLVVGPQIQQQLHLQQQRQQQLQLLAQQQQQQQQLYGNATQEPVDVYRYQAGTLPYDVSGYAATGVNYAVLYDNQYASLARPASTARYATAAPIAPSYGTLPTKGVAAQQQQWRRHSEMVYHQATPYPVPIVYDASTGAYYASANPQLQARGIPIWSESEQAYVAADGLHGLTHPNQVSYVVDPVVKAKSQLQQQQKQQPQQQQQPPAHRVPGGQVFIPEPDYPGATEDGLVNGSGQPFSVPQDQEKVKQVAPQQQQQNGFKRKTVTFAPFVTEASPEGTQTEKYSKLPFQNNAEFIELDSIQL